MKLTILKIGGKLLDDEEMLSKALEAFSQIKGPKILVHGGGKKGSEISRRLGIEPQMVDGRRITDAATLEVVTMVYCGLLNKQIVAQLQSFGCNALGLSGPDGNAIHANLRPSGEVDYGLAGDVDVVNKKLIINLLKKGITPVFSPITHNGSGQLLNTNADTIARMLAAALSKEFEVTLKFCFEKNGVLLTPDDDSSVMKKLSKTDYKLFRSNGTISEGMIPKLDNAFAAKKGGVSKVWVCGVGGISQRAGTKIKI